MSKVVRGLPIVIGLALLGASAASASDWGFSFGFRGGDHYHGRHVIVDDCGPGYYYPYRSSVVYSHGYSRGYYPYSYGYPSVYRSTRVYRSPAYYGRTVYRGHYDRGPYHHGHHSRRVVIRR